METFLDPKIPDIFRSLFKSDENFGRPLINEILTQSAPFTILQCIEENRNVSFKIYVTIQDSLVVKLICEDKFGEKHVIAIWLAWSETFRSRIVMKAKREADASPYKMHTICFANLIMDTTSDSYWQRYNFTDDGILKCPDGQDIIVIELPKFKILDPQAPTESELWLSFLADINGNVKEAPQHLLDHPDTAAALELIRRDRQSLRTIKICEAFLRDVERRKAAISQVESDLVLLRRLYRI